MTRSRWAPHRLIQRHGRLFAAMGLGIAALLILPAALRLTTRFVIGWDLLTLFYVVTTGRLMVNTSIAHCRNQAALYDEGDWVILVITLGGAIASFATIFAELAASKAAGTPFLNTFLLTAATVALSWAFTHMTFALHYANLYYRTEPNGTHGGLDFPGEREPDYRDFLYYAFVIACAAQTADVNTLSSDMRRVTLIHCITAFAFNSAILALMINITAGLMG